MGIDWHSAKFLIGCARNGVKFERTLTLGRQWLLTEESDLRELFSEHGAVPFDLESTLARDKTYADGLWRLLGAADLAVLDTSSYEGASVLHDLNMPLDLGTETVRKLRGQFDVVFDGGTLEHVFNFPAAIKNAMELVKVGGHLILATPANNFLGHGFYQFSPELFFRVLSPDNGFVIERLLAFEYFPGSQWYEVADPAAIKSRVELVGIGHRLLLLVRARRIKEVDIFRTVPQQSDYQVAWDANANGSDSTNRSPCKSGTVSRKRSGGFSSLIPTRVRRSLKTVMRRLPSRIIRLMQARKDLRDNRCMFMDSQPRLFRPVSD